MSRIDWVVNNPIIKILRGNGYRAPGVNLIGKHSDILSRYLAGDITEDEVIVEINRGRVLLVEFTFKEILHYSFRVVRDYRVIQQGLIPIMDFRSKQSLSKSYVNYMVILNRAYTKGV